MDLHAVSRRPSSRTYKHFEEKHANKTHLTDESGTGILHGVGELDGPGNGDAVVDDLGIAELVEDHIATYWMLACKGFGKDRKSTFMPSTWDKKENAKQ